MTEKAQPWEGEGSFGAVGPSLTRSDWPLLASSVCTLSASSDSPRALSWMQRWLCMNYFVELLTTLRSQGSFGSADFFKPRKRVEVGKAAQSRFGPWGWCSRLLLCVGGAWKSLLFVHESQTHVAILALGEVHSETPALQQAPIHGGGGRGWVLHVRLPGPTPPDARGVWRWRPPATSSILATAGPDTGLCGLATFHHLFRSYFHFFCFSYFCYCALFSDHIFRIVQNHRTVRQGVGRSTEQCV